LGINSASTIVGDYQDQNLVNHGFIYQKGQFAVVDYFGASNTDLTGINDLGQMVGGYGTMSSSAPRIGPLPDAFFLDQGNFTPFQAPVGDAQVSWTDTLNGDQFVGLYADSLETFYGYEAPIGH
jgi:uncharacterized membrane protein